MRTDAVPLGSRISVRYGKAHPRGDRKPTGAFPVVGSAGTMARTASPLVTGPVLVVGRKGNIGQVTFCPDGCWPTDTTYFLVCPEDILPVFLMHQLRSLDLTKLDSSTATPSLRRQDLEKQMLWIPPVDEQARIVAIIEEHISHLDAAEMSLRSARTNLAASTELITRRALTGAGKARGSSVPLAPAGTADGSLEPLPNRWRWDRLGRVAEVVGGVTKDSKNQSNPEFVERPYLRVANVQRGEIRPDHVKTIRVPPKKAQALELKPGDVLLNEGGDRDKLARGWVWEGQIPQCIHQNHVFRARIHDPDLDPYFLSLTANTFGGKWAERNGKQSVNLASISLSMIRNMPVIVPAPGEATEAVAHLREQQASLDRALVAIKDAERRGALLRRAILDAAFRGNFVDPAAGQ